MDLSQSPCEISWRNREHLFSAGSISDGGLWEGGMCLLGLCVFGGQQDKAESEGGTCIKSNSLSLDHALVGCEVLGSLSGC